MVQKGVLASDGERTARTMKIKGSRRAVSFESARLQGEGLGCCVFGGVVQGSGRETNALGVVFFPQRSAWSTASGWAHNR